MVWFVIFLVLTKIVSSLCDCEVQNDIGPVLVLQKIADDYVISTNPNKIEIPSNGVLELFCASGFTKPYRNSYDEYDRDIEYLITSKCVSDSAYFHDNSGRYPLSELRCTHFRIPFYSTKIDTCAYSGLQFGMVVKGTPVVLAEFCYNFNALEVVSIHYFAEKRSVMLMEQKSFNPSRRGSNGVYTEAPISLKTKEYARVLLDTTWKAFSPYAVPIVKQLQFEFYELVPSSAYSGFLDSFTGDVNMTNLIPWWTHLRNGNWKFFQNIFNRHTMNVSYEVYAGKSGTVEYPKDFLCNPEYKVTYKEDDQEKTIPLYIWNYLIPKHQSDTHKEFVVVAVNTPFFEESMIFCEDICESIDWLKPLVLTRKNPVFGVIFCCRPEEVQGRLQGFPQVNVNETALTDKKPLVNLHDLLSP